MANNEIDERKEAFEIYLYNDSNISQETAESYLKNIEHKVVKQSIPNGDTSIYEITDSKIVQSVIDKVKKDKKDQDGKCKYSAACVKYKKFIVPYTNGTTPQQKYKDNIKQLLLETHNLVLTGAPGTGKTHLAQEIAQEMGAVKKFVQFHPSYDYTDFVEGLRPFDKDKKGNGQIGFKREDGVFKDFCKEAIKNMKKTQANSSSGSDEKPNKEVLETAEQKPYVFIIDEINRGEVSKIFGELFYAIDPGYRGKTNDRVQTQYQNLVPTGDEFKDGFYVPENVYILATMNDIDRSVESMDFAIRRRFTWIEVTPDDTEYMLDSLKQNAKDAKNTMKRLNKEISGTEGLGPAYRVGPAYFLKLKDYGGDFDKLWKMNISPLLKEYLRGFRKQKQEEIMGEFEKAYFNKQLHKTQKH